MIFFLLLSLIRIIFVQLLSIMWSRIPGVRTDASGITFSILIPVRNEAENIVRLLEDLENQNYPFNLFDVIVADDHSEDNTHGLVESFAKKSSLNIQVVQLEEQMGKKAAISTAIKKAKNEYILATDGDCRLSPNWIKSYAAGYSENRETLMITGPVSMKAENLFTNMQRLEFAALLGFGSSSLQMGIPGTCNGANLSYKRSVFHEVGGYQGNEKIPSGDDEFLMFKIFKKYPGGIRFLKSLDAVVTTQAKKTVRDLVNQRIRWSSKWRFHKSKYVTLAALLFFVDYVVLTGTVVMTLFGFLNYELVASILLLRWLTEYFFISGVIRFLDGKSRWFHFLLMQIIYPPFVIFLGIASIFGIYHWKGRAYS